MRNHALTLIYLCLSLYTFGQVPAEYATDTSNKDAEFFDKVDEMPQFPGGEVGLMKYLTSIEYPKEAKANKIQGEVYVRFLVDEQGQVMDVSTVRDVDPILDAAAIAHIQNMPIWTPGKKAGEPVKVQYIVPIRFRLNGNASQKNKRG